MASFHESDGEPRSYLFSYGSNSTQQLRAQIQNPTLITKPAILKGYVRVFCSKSEDWGGGGVASLAPSKAKNAVTYGSVARLTPEEFERLDKFEEGARRVNVTVCVGQKSNKEVEAIAYVVGKKPTTPDAPFTPPLKIPPTEQYIWAVHTHLREHWSIDSITVRSNDKKKGVVEVDEKSVVDIDPSELSLEALCVEISSYKSHPWVMQQAIDRVVHKLNQVGITDTKELIMALKDPILLNNHIKAKGYSAFQFETLSIMKKLLFPNHKESESNSSGGGGASDSENRNSEGSVPALGTSIDGADIREVAEGTDKTLVFSYGSNSTAQLRARVQNPHLMTYPATLKGYVRVFCKHSERWGGGGVASLGEPKLIFIVVLTCEHIVFFTRLYYYFVLSRIYMYVCVC
jgi:cation transport regulator ChaC